MLDEPEALWEKGLLFCRRRALQDSQNRGKNEDEGLTEIQNYPAGVSIFGRIEPSPIDGLRIIKTLDRPVCKFKNVGQRADTKGCEVGCRC